MTLARVEARPQDIGSVHKDSLHRMPQALTPPLTPPGAQHAETIGNRQQRNRPRYADFATLGNAWTQVSADCGSEGRGFEPRRSPPICRQNAQVRLHVSLPWQQ